MRWLAVFIWLSPERPVRRGGGRISSAGPGDETLAVERRRADPPAESVKVQECRGSAEGQSGVYHVERNERRRRDRWRLASKPSPPYDA
jgi:hypothetical protein